MRLNFTIRNELLLACASMFILFLFSTTTYSQDNKPDRKRVEVKTHKIGKSTTTKTINFTEENGKKKVEVVTLENGVETTEVFEGKEAEEYMQKSNATDIDFDQSSYNFSFSYNEDDENDHNIVVEHIEVNEKEIEEALEKIEIKIDDLKEMKVLKEAISDLNDIDIDIDISDGNDHVKIVKINTNGLGEHHNKVVVISNSSNVSSQEEADELLNEMGVSIDVDENAEGTVKTIVYKKIIRIENVTKEDALSSNEKLSVTEMNLYPNPSTGQFKIEFEPEKAAETHILVTDVNGKELFSDTYDGEGKYQKELDLSSEKSGIYFVQIRQGKKQHTKKIVVQ